LSNQEVIQYLRDQGLNVFPCANKQPMMKAWQNEIYTEKITTENFGVRMGDSNIIVIDIDDIELLPYFEYLKNKTYMVRTGKGFHIYIKVKQLGKIQRLDNDQGQHIDIQSTGSYVIGESSLHESGKHYELLSKDRKINEISFDSIKDILENLGFMKQSKQANYKMRQRFLDGKPPAKNTSNLYFFNASLQCNTDGLTRNEALQKILDIFDKWKCSASYSGRSWSNVETAINKVYDEDKKIQQGGNNKKDNLELEDFKKELLKSRKIFSDISNKILYENRDGFLVNINEDLHRELLEQYPTLEQKQYSNLVFQLLGLASKVPEKDNDLIVFPNGTWSHRQHKRIDTDLNKLAYMGFEDFEYVENPNPEQFIEVMFDNIPDEQYPRIKAGLKAIFQPKLDSTISVIHGLSGAGKSTGVSILGKILGDYALFVRPQDLVADKFMKAELKDKQILILLELPLDFSDFNYIKTLTGENTNSIRGIYSKADKNTKTTLKIWSSTNYLCKIPEHEKDSMFNRRLSLIEKGLPEKPYKNNTEFDDEVIESEGSDIISWILNLTDEECQYESKETVQKAWENISNPEQKWIKNNFVWSSVTDEKSLYDLLKKFEQVTKTKTDAKNLETELKELGYFVRQGIVRNLKEIVPKIEPKKEGQQEL